VKSCITGPVQQSTPQGASVITGSGRPIKKGTKVSYYR